jgi:3-dehydroquinate synthase
MAAVMSREMGWMSDDEAQRTIRLIEQARLPSKAPASMSTEKFLKLMSVDKKVLNGVIRLVLMKGIGQSLVTADYKPEDLHKAIELSLDS